MFSGVREKDALGTNELKRVKFAGKVLSKVSQWLFSRHCIYSSVESFGQCSGNLFLEERWSDNILNASETTL